MTTSIGSPITLNAPKDTIFLVNPSANKSKCERYFNSFYASYSDTSSEDKMFFSTEGESLGDIAVKFFEENIDVKNYTNSEPLRFIVAGGDGSVSEVLSKFHKRFSDVPNDQRAIQIGILPFGTNNDLAGSLNIPKFNRRNYSALKNYVNGKQGAQIGHFEVSDSYQTLFAWEEFDMGLTERTMASYQTGNHCVPFLPWIAIKEGWNWPNVRLKIQRGEQIEPIFEGNYVFAAASTCGRFGGGFKLNPTITPKWEYSQGSSAQLIVYSQPQSSLSLVNNLTLIKRMINLKTGEHLHQSWGVQLPLEPSESYKFTLNESMNETRMQIDGELIECKSQVEVTWNPNSVILVAGDKP
ncbi:hypothetical protein D5018_05855 [Parashewanella curva]|uniref:DAGKc domain-containing protein n=1 Tax=Parashewanella curva TaxID=2338552 RepID=A0A3L8PZ20_9GAMM|nr:diacylglycerol kinase family protein [Parashewanella curva]RLV60624.1 hypothetical protein D5018_05855 [Parashewanella curva]